MMENKESTRGESKWKQMGYEEKKSTVQEEMKRMNQLPANSTYASHRLRVLNKRTRSEEEELELLFATLSL